MAKGNLSASAQQRRIIPEEIELKLRSLFRRIDVAQCTAICIEMTLLQQKSLRERQFALCVEEHLANELGRISRDASAIFVALGLRPHTPEGESPILGMMLRPIPQKPADDGQ